MALVYTVALLELLNAELKYPIQCWCRYTPRLVARDSSEDLDTVVSFVPLPYTGDDTRIRWE